MFQEVLVCYKASLDWSREMWKVPGFTGGCHQVNGLWNIPDCGWGRNGWCSPETDGSREPLLSFSPLRVCTQLLKWPMKAHYLLVGGLNWSWNAEKQWCAETWVNVSMSAALPHGINGGINDNKLLCNAAIWPYISVVSRACLIREAVHKEGNQSGGTRVTATRIISRPTDAMRYVLAPQPPAIP